MNNAEQSAYPFTSSCDGYTVGYSGLTKREYFAGLMMQALVTRHDDEMNMCSDDPDALSAEELAVWIADRLLEALETRPSSA